MAKKGRVYVSGCGGMLGEAVYSQFKDEYELKCTDIDLNDDWLSYCDITKLEDYKMDVVDSNGLRHCMARAV